MNKTLILAAVTAITLSAGAAMAQETGAVIDYWGQRNVEMLQRQAAPHVQSSGSLHSFVVQSHPALEVSGTSPAAAATREPLRKRGRPPAPALFDSNRIGAVRLPRLSLMTLVTKRARYPLRHHRILGDRVRGGGAGTDRGPDGVFLPATRHLTRPSRPPPASMAPPPRRGDTFLDALSQDCWWRTSHVPPTRSRRTHPWPIPGSRS